MRLSDILEWTIKKPCHFLAKVKGQDHPCDNEQCESLKVMQFICVDDACFIMVVTCRTGVKLSTPPVFFASSC
ncbi:MAG: hypothetical protein CR997_13500 [Acidobacteria bacterium]|nr:MAG: hypothetical protein CR997_13500 [Acidobacteriota bacterium]